MAAAEEKTVIAAEEEMGMALDEVETTMKAKESAEAGLGGGGDGGLRRPYYAGRSDGKAVLFVSKDGSFTSSDKLGKKIKREKIRISRWMSTDIQWLAFSLRRALIHRLG